MAEADYGELRCRDHSIYDCDLFPFLPAEVALIEGNEEGAKAGAEDERASGKDQRDEAERSTSERTSGGTTAIDEGRESAWRLFAAIDSDAVPGCALPREPN